MKMLRNWNLSSQLFCVKFANELIGCLRKNAAVPSASAFHKPIMLHLMLQITNFRNKCEIRFAILISFDAPFGKPIFHQGRIECYAFINQVTLLHSLRYFANHATQEIRILLLKKIQSTLLDSQTFCRQLAEFIVVDLYSYLLEESIFFSPAMSTSSIRTQQEH